MSISTTELGGQLAAETYNQLLKIIERHSQAAHPLPRRQNWRFQPPQRSAKTETALRAYWGGLFKDELKALEVEWADPRTVTPIIADESTPPEVTDVSISQAV